MSIQLFLDWIQSSISATSARVVHAPRTRAWNSLSPDDREITVCVVAPAKIGCLPSFKCVQPELFRVTRQVAQFASLTPTILGGSGLSRVAPQQPRPDELFQCYMSALIVGCAIAWLLSLCDMVVWSVQCDEQISHASALVASGLGSCQASSCKRVLCLERGRVPKTVFPWLFPCSKPWSRKKKSTCRESPSYVIIVARNASDDLHLGTRFRVRISRWWCGTRPKHPRSFVVNLLLTCCLHHSRCTSAPSPTKSSPCTKHHNRRVLCR